MSWTGTIPTIVAALVVLFLPGSILARAMGARGLTLLAASAPLSTSIAAVAAIVGQLLRVPWSPLVYAAAALVATLAAAAVRYLCLRRSNASGAALHFTFPSLPAPARMAAFFLALAIPAALIGARFVQIIGEPENISQTYDNVFHVNALRFILETGKGSSLTLGNLNPVSNSLSFYPAAWHDVVALVLQLSGASIPVGINITNIVVAALVWPLSAMFLVSRITGQRVIPMLMAGALAAGFSSFPYLMIDFGVLFPNLLSIALLPFSMAALIAWLGIGRSSGGSRHLLFWLLAASCAGLALAHPSSLMALIAFAALPVFAWLIRTIRKAGSYSRPVPTVIASVAAVTAYVVVAVVLWIKVRPSASASFWPPRETIPQAIGEFITSAPQGRPVPWLIFLMTLVGISVLVRSRRDWWVLALFGVCGAFFVVVSGYPVGTLRSFLTGVWYNDSNRLAAILPVTALVVAASGAGWLVEQLLHLLRTRAPRPWLRNRASAAVALLVVALASAALTQGNSVGHEAAQATVMYRATKNSPLLSSDELALLQRLDTHVPEGATVIGNPWTGASLVYALSDRTAMLPAVGSTPTPSQRLILDKVDKAASDPAVCAALKEQNSYYALDFGTLEVNNGKHPYKGLAGLSGAPGIRLLDSQGTARLYEITACR